LFLKGKKREYCGLMEGGVYFQGGSAIKKKSPCKKKKWAKI